MLVRKNFVRIEYSLRIERPLDLLHHLNGFLGLAEPDVVALLEPQAVLGADAALLQEEQSKDSLHCAD